MYYFKIDIPSLFIPEREFHWEELKMIVVPSRKNSKGNVITLDNTLLTLIIYSEEKLTVEEVTGKIRNLVNFLIFFASDYNSARWLIHKWWGGVEQQIKTTRNIRVIVNRSIEIGQNRPKFLYRNYDAVPLAFREDPLYNFNDLIKKYFALEEKSKLKEQIDLLAFTWVLPSSVSNLYNNVNLEISLTYTLIDSIIKDSGIDQSDKKTCENCGYETKGRKSDKKRIKEFVRTLGLSQPETALLEKIIFNIYKIRNAFFHEGKIISILENMRIAMQDKEGLAMTSISIEHEAEHGQSRMLGLFTAKGLIRSILLELLNS